MAVEQRIYKGDLIQKSLAIVDRICGEKLGYYILSNGAGNFGVACEMLESEAEMRNVRLAGAGSEYRWTFQPKKGVR